MSEYLEVGLFLVASAFFYVVTMFMASLVSPHVPTAAKQSPYECGERPVGEAQVRFGPNYYIIALIFVLFDVEAIFLFPWAAALREVGMAGFIEMLVFIGVLLIGLIYAWRKKVLSWI